VDVQQEGSSLSDLVFDRGQTGTEVEISHVRLGTTTEYDSRRCQRGFIYVELPKVPPAVMIRELEEALKREPEARAIVESVCRSDNAVVLELFMTCAQSVRINQLNRTLEEVLPRYSVQKYTLLCYGYEEREVAIGEGAGAAQLERKAG
jgi:hypothetical protein